MRLLFTALACLISVSVFGQDLHDINLNGYKYLVIKDTEYVTTKDQIYNKLNREGYTIIKDNYIPDDLNENPDLALYLVADEKETFWEIETTISLYNFNDELVWEGEKQISGVSSGAAIKKALIPFFAFDYKYNPSLRLKKIKLNQTDETESSLMSYFDNNTLAEIEGLYTTVQTREKQEIFKIGIKKFENEFKGIITSSSSDAWQIGEEKFTLVPTSIKNTYSIKYYTDDKSLIQTLCTLEENLILNVNMFSKDIGIDQNETFVKLYPLR